jgi:hypothetical protein
MAKRKTIPPKLTLKVLKRDNYKCQICGKSPSTYPELSLEVDHILPVSKGGTNDIENLQTLCFYCNRGKGNDGSLNVENKERIDILLERINPEILNQLSSNGGAKVVANEADFSELMTLSEIYAPYDIQVIPNTIMGYHAGYNLGIYTVNDNGGSKVNFAISLR